MPAVPTRNGAPNGRLGRPLTGSSLMGAPATAQAHAYRTALERRDAVLNLEGARGIGAELDAPGGRGPNDRIARLLLGWASQALAGREIDGGRARCTPAAAEPAFTGVYRSG